MLLNQLKVFGNLARKRRSRKCILLVGLFIASSLWVCTKSFFQNYVKLTVVASNDVWLENPILREMVSQNHSTMSAHPSTNFSGSTKLASPPKPKQVNIDNTTRRNKIVYIHTEFTGSATLSNIFSSYGYRHGLNMLMGTDGYSELDTSEMEPGLSWKVCPHESPIHIMEQHARYNHQFFQKHFSQDTAYVTSIKEPVQWWIDEVNYRADHGPVTINEVLNDGMRFYRERGYTISGLNTFSHNSFLEHLGFEIYKSGDDGVVQEYIKFIDEQFDLVMIWEYFDESLVLLKRLMNWSLVDIFYTESVSPMPKIKLRNQKIPAATLSAEEVEKLLDEDHNRADWLLYQHFNATFWNKVSLQQEFYKEVEEFKRLNQLVREYCMKRSQQDHKEQFQFFLSSGKNLTVTDVDCLPLRVIDGQAEELSSALDKYCPSRKGTKSLAAGLKKENNNLQRHFRYQNIRLNPLQAKQHKNPKIRLPVNARKHPRVMLKHPN